MDERNYRNILEQMDEGIAFFHLILDENNKPVASIIDACNEHYLDISEQSGINRNHVLHHNYYDIAPDHDPRWDYYVYQAAIKRKHVHGEFRNREFGTWMEFSGGPAVEEDTCWLMFIDHTKYQNENERLLKERNIDQLTGVNNRNAYEDAVSEYKKQSVSLGVIMADINGLKEMNDSHGHRSGDKLIEDAAVFLCEINTKQLPYRIGGDEFVLLMENCEKEEVDKAVEHIRRYENVSISCGGFWTDNSHHIDTAIKKADQNMYEDKKQYYRNHERRHVQ